MNLRKVQAFAGHRKASTTEKYRQSQLEELRKVINRFHPLA
jgi:integrase/recombinase XerD